MSQRADFLNWVLKQADKPSLWAAKGPEAFDCSGLVTCGFVAVGVDAFAPKFSNTDKLWNALASSDKPTPGDLVFYGGKDPRDVSHVMIWWGDGRVFGACGATSLITTIRDAQRANARVRFRNSMMYRGDFRGFRRSPFDSEENHDTRPS